MTNEKAKDFFSAYYEGSLEPGLSLSFKQKLDTDRDLSGEYHAFVRAMESLDSLRLEEISIPDGLHERISARLDRHIWEQKQTAKPVFGIWLKRLAFGGIGLLAIGGAYISLNRNSAVSESNLIGIGASDNQLAVEVTDGGISVKSSSGTDKPIIVVDSDGKTVAQGVNNSLLQNNRPSAVAFGIRFEAKDSPVSYVALPGRMHSSINAGEGSVVDFATALADHYSKPVLLRTSKAQEKMNWTFGSTDAVSEASRNVGTKYRVSLMKDNLLQIEEN